MYSSTKQSWLNYLILALCVIGILAAGYLSYTRIFHQPIVCTTGEGCDRVNSSEYAHFLGIPVAFIGFTGYVVLLAVSLARRLSTNRIVQERLDWILFLGGLIGFVFSMYLTAMELFVINAICTWCVINAIVITLLFCLYSYRIWSGTPEMVEGEQT